MVDVWASRYQPGLKMGDGALINWEVGEVCVVVEGADLGRRFVVTSRRYADERVPAGEFVREGHFEDDPDTTWCIREGRLWFTAESAAKVAEGQRELGLV